MTEGVHDQPEGELGHILRRFIGIGGQPGFHQTDAAGKTERVGIFQVFNSVRKSPAQYVKTVGGNQISMRWINAISPFGPSKAMQISLFSARI